MRRILAVLVFASTGVFCSTASFAGGCHAPSAPASFPDPSTATETDILAAQQAVKQYLTDMESALKCMDSEHNDSAHNTAVDDMQKTASKFNTVLRAFKSKQKA